MARWAKITLVRAKNRTRGIVREKIFISMIFLLRPSTKERHLWSSREIQFRNLSTIRRSSLASISMSLFPLQFRLKVKRGTRYRRHVARGSLLSKVEEKTRRMVSLVIYCNVLLFFWRNTIRSADNCKRRMDKLGKDMTLWLKS